MKALRLARPAAAVGAMIAAAAGAHAWWSTPAESLVPTAAVEPATRPPPHFDSEQEKVAWTVRVLEEALAGEERDDAWASAKEDALRSLVGDDDLGGVQSIDAECRATVCKLDVTFSAESSLRTLQVLRLHPELQAGGYHARSAGGVTMFLAREGSDLSSHPHLVEAAAAL